MKKVSYSAFLLLLIPSIVGCISVPISKAELIAGKASFTKEYIKSGNFTLLTLQRFNKNSDTLRVYIEGDGRAWASKYQLSDDPTPANPVALKLAAVDLSDDIAYIARPGQYSPSGLPNCNSKYWSDARFAPEVVESIDKIISKLKERSGAKYVELVGYSGGGAIAVLVTARRRDVKVLRTVAGDLNTDLFCTLHHVSPMISSLNPLDVAQQIKMNPQRHFVGSMDTIVPRSIVGSFVKMEGDTDDKRITVVDGVSHNQGWEKHWRELLLMN